MSCSKLEQTLCENKWLMVATIAEAILVVALVVIVVVIRGRLRGLGDSSPGSPRLGLWQLLRGDRQVLSEGCVRRSRSCTVL